MGILEGFRGRREPVAAYRTIDGGHPAPYPDMTDEQLYNYEVTFNVPRRTFAHPPTAAAPPSGSGSSTTPGPGETPAAKVANGKGASGATHATHPTHAIHPAYAAHPGNPTDRAPGPQRSRAAPPISPAPPVPPKSSISTMTPMRPDPSLRPEPTLHEEWLRPPSHPDSRMQSYRDGAPGAFPYEEPRLDDAWLRQFDAGAQGRGASEEHGVHASVAPGQPGPRLRRNKAFDAPRYTARRTAAGVAGTAGAAPAGNVHQAAHERAASPAAAPPALDLSKPVRLKTSKQPVDIITTRARHPVYKVHGYIGDDDVVTVFTLDGRLSENGPCFLENAPQMQELHLNIYLDDVRTGTDRYRITQHATRAEADAAAEAGRLQCVQVKLGA